MKGKKETGNAEILQPIAIFDLDGTLVDTSGDLLAAANAVFTEAGYPAPLERGRDRVLSLHGGRAMLTEGVKRLGIENGAHFIQHGYAPLLRHYKQNLHRESRLYPDVHAVLSILRAEGVLTAICTNKPIWLAIPLLRHFDLYENMSAIIGQKSLPVAKPNAAPILATIDASNADRRRAVLIGDSATDANAAKAAGISAVLVDFDESGISKDYPEYPIAYKFSELTHLLNETFEKQVQIA